MVIVFNNKSKVMLSTQHYDNNFDLSTFTISKEELNFPISCVIKCPILIDLISNLSNFEGRSDDKDKLFGSVC